MKTVMPNNLLDWLPRWSLASGRLVTLIIVGLVLTPVMVNQFIPLHDYPFHLARIVILADLDNPIYSEFYKAGSFLLPNMAMDMVAVPLAAIVGAETASRIFVMLSLVSMLLGTMMLHWAVHKRFSPWPLFAVVFLFNGIFRYGFLNYIFGLGIAFLAAALWIQMKPSVLKIAIALLMSLLLIMLHFAAFAVFAVIVGCCEIYATGTRWSKEGAKTSLFNLIVSASPFLLAIILFLMVSPTAEGTGEGLGIRDLIQYKTLDRLYEGALYSLITGIPWLNIVCFTILTIIFSVYLFKRQIKFAPNLLLGLTTMTLLYVILPFSLMGSLFADVRLVPAIALLGVASIDIKAQHIKSDRVIASSAILLSILIAIGVTRQWGYLNTELSSISRVFEKTETGSTIFSATAQPYPGLIANSPGRRAAWNPPLKHVASYAVLSGPKFVPMTFVDPTKQPLNVTDKYSDIKDFQTFNPRKTPTAAELELFIQEIKNHLDDGKWPPLEHVYVVVMGYDLIKDKVNLAALGDWAQIAEFNEHHVLIKIK